MSESKSIGKLISIIHRKSQTYFQQKLEPMDLSHGQVKIFVFLKEHDGATQNEISNFFKLDKSTTSFLIKKMVENDYVQKKIDPTDRRSFKLHLTEKAMRKFNRLMDIFLGWSELLLNDFSPKEKKTAFNFLNKMIVNIDFLDEQTET